MNRGPAAFARQRGRVGLGVIFTMLFTAPVAGAAPAAKAVPESGEASTRVCVEVEMKSWTREGEREPAPASAPVLPPPPPPPPRAGRSMAASQRIDPEAIDPDLYLRRLMEYEVTHEAGFAAVREDCQQRVTVELYPLKEGWTVFARYSGHEREEKVDEVEVDEFAPLAERVVRALLRDVAVAETLNRENVLRDDSEGRLRSVRGRGHFILGLGSQLLVGSLPTAQGSGQNVSDEWRVPTPFSFQLGYRGKFQTWGLDAFFRASIGTDQRAARSNPGGGHVDFSGAGGLGVHFLSYHDPAGVSSLYYGGGAAFELARYTVIEAHDDAGNPRGRDALWGGGLNLEGVLGYEFMRASALHFYTEMTLQLPTYRFDTENDAGGLKSYVPGAMVLVGMIF